jgi:hypothetical protein
MGPSFAELADIAEMDARPDLPGVYFPPHPGQDGIPRTMDDFVHTPMAFPICSAEQIASNQISNPLCYHSNPPTSGPHAPQTTAWGVLNVIAAKESLVHNMEHGGVVIWVNTNNANIVMDLTRIVTASVNARGLVVMTRYPEMEPETIALTSWTRLDKFPVSDYTMERVTRFILAHERRFNPEGF